MLVRMKRKKRCLDASSKIGFRKSTNKKQNKT